MQRTPTIRRLFPIITKPVTPPVPSRPGTIIPVYAGQRERKLLTMEMPPATATKNPCGTGQRTAKPVR